MAIGIVLVAGCATWSAPEIDPDRLSSARLPTPRMSPDTVVLEVARVRLPADVDPADLWHEVDEQHVDAKVRRRLRTNGIRSGVAGSQLPATLLGLLDHDGSENDADVLQTLESKLGYHIQRLQCRSNDHRRIVVSDDIRDSLVVLTSQDGVVRGETCEQGQCLLALRTRPQADGRVELELTPEIEYGQPRMRFVGRHEQGAFLMDASRQRRVFDDLQLKTTLFAGQTLVITSQHPPFGLGQTFFVEPSAQGQQRKMLLIRLAQTQIDDLHGPQPNPTPLVTQEESRR